MAVKSTLFDNILDYFGNATGSNFDMITLYQINNDYLVNRGGMDFFKYVNDLKTQISQDNSILQVKTISYDLHNMVR